MWRQTHALVLPKVGVYLSTSLPGSVNHAGSPSILENDELLCKISFQETTFEAIQSCPSGFLLSRSTKSDGEPNALTSDWLKPLHRLSLRQFGTFLVLSGHTIDSRGKSA